MIRTIFFPSSPERSARERALLSGSNLRDPCSAKLWSGGSTMSSVSRTRWWWRQQQDWTWMNNFSFILFVVYCTNISPFYHTCWKIGKNPQHFFNKFYNRSKSDCAAKIGASGNDFNLCYRLGITLMIIELRWITFVISLAFHFAYTFKRRQFYFVLKMTFFLGNMK